MLKIFVGLAAAICIYGVGYATIGMSHKYKRPEDVSNGDKQLLGLYIAISVAAQIVFGLM